METIEKLRSKINKIDSDIIKKISQRNAISIKIGKLKLKAGSKVFDSQREKELNSWHKSQSIKYHVGSKLIKEIFKMIIVHSRVLQK